MCQIDVEEAELKGEAMNIQYSLQGSVPLVGSMVPLF
jgi:hypothetical protein